MRREVPRQDHPKSLTERDPVFELFSRKRGRAFLKSVGKAGEFENSRNQAAVKTSRFCKLNFCEKYVF